MLLLSGVEATSDLPQFLRDGCGVLSLRRADLRHEVRQLDVRWFPGTVFALYNHPLLAAGHMMVSWFSVCFM